MLTIALERVDFLPANRVTDDTSILTLKNLVLEPLLRWQKGGLVAPALFSHWNHSEDGRFWEFFIRKNARFHDGVFCQPEHIIEFLNGILQSVDMFGMKWSYARYLADAVITAGQGSVRIQNPEPFADILDIFSEFYICRSDEHGRPVLGTGPYRVETFEAGKETVLQRLRGSGPERICALAQPRAENRLAWLQSGKIDAALNLERVEGRLNFDADFQWSRSVNTLSVMYYLNCAEGMFASPQVRLAANHAVDKETLIETVLDGLGVAAATVVSPFHLGMARLDLKPLAYDPDKARRLLDEAGGAGDIVLRTPTHMPERAPAISRFVAASLEEIGLSVRLDLETDRPDYARQVGRKQMGDMAIFDSSPHSTFRVLDDKISSRSQAVWWQGFTDPQTDDLIMAARRQISDGAREQAYGRCLERLNRHPPWLYLLHPIEVLAHRPEIGGIAIDHKGTLTIAGTDMP